MSVPDVQGLRPAEAFAAIAEAGLQPVLLGAPTLKTDGNFGYVVAAQEPAGGAAAKAGERVAVALRPHMLSWGSIDSGPVAPRGTPAPEVVGVELESAIRQVTDSGLVAVVLQPSRAVTSIAVARQDPEAGQPVGEFREVVLQLD